MTRLPPTVLAAALAASAGLHLASLGLLRDAPTVRQEGGAPASVAALGTSFADLAAGTIAAAAPRETARAAQATPAATPAPVASDPVRAPRAAPAAQPEPAERPAAAAAAGRQAMTEPPPRAVARSVAPGTAPRHETAARPAPVPVPMPARAALTSDVARGAAAASKAPSPVPQADGPAPVPPRVATAEEVAASPPVTVDSRVVAASDLAPEAYLRPPSRPVSRPPTPADTPRRIEQTPRSSAAPEGNADRSARAGQDSGRRDAEAARAANQPATNAAPGNAAASTYPGLVMRHVSRARRPDVAARGAARVTFRIAGSGALAWASLSRSSGSAALDRAALNVIRRAAPFPPPPSGATRTFTVETRGR